MKFKKKKIESLFGRINPTREKYHAVSWNTMMLPKNLGDMAMCNLTQMNKACLMKLGWLFALSKMAYGEKS